MASKSSSQIRAPFLAGGECRLIEIFIKCLHLYLLKNKRIKDIALIFISTFNLTCLLKKWICEKDHKIKSNDMIIKGNFVYEGFNRKHICANNLKCVRRRYRHVKLMPYLFENHAFMIGKLTTQQTESHGVMVEN